MADSKKIQIQWQALEYQHYEKNIGWYVTLISVAILVIGFFIIIEQDWFAAITVVLIAVVLIGFARKRPEEVTVKLDNKGLHVNKLLFPYKQIRDFWIVHNEHHKTINFNTVTYIRRTLIVQLNGQDPDEIRSFLLQYLPEHPQTQETLAQKVSHKFKF